MALPSAEIGIFGGTGFYRFLDNLREVAVATPFGPPSAKVAVGELGGRQVAFLARHGVDHEFPPTGSTSGPTCGLSGASACVGSWRPARWGRCNPT